jgi:hypothetical protein
MTNSKFKSQITQTTANTIISEEVNLSFPSGKNAYRLESIKCQIDDFDAIADDDLFKIQLAYESLDGGSFVTIDDKDEILTLAERIHIGATGTPAANGEPSDGGNGWFDKLRDQGILYRDGKDFKDVFIAKEKFYVNFNTAGQDAVEELHYVITGQYVNLPQKIIDGIKQGVTLT